MTGLTQTLASRDKCDPAVLAVIFRKAQEIQDPAHVASAHRGHGVPQHGKAKRRFFAAAWEGLGYYV